MKNAIVFSSVTGNTKLLAEKIQETLGDVAYCGKASDEALEADAIYIGSWAQAFSCTPDIKEFLGKVKGKKVFIFMTAGYGSTEDFFNPIIDSVKALVDSSNEIIGEFICQGKVSEGKQKAIKDGDEAKYNTMKPELDKSVSHPDDADVAKLVEAVKKSM